jgi:hypothetical protein
MLVGASRRCWPEGSLCSDLVICTRKEVLRQRLNQEWHGAQQLVMWLQSVCVRRPQSMWMRLLRHRHSPPLTRDQVRGGDGVLTGSRGSVEGAEDDWHGQKREEKRKEGCCR